MQPNDNVNANESDVAQVPESAPATPAPAKAKKAKAKTSVKKAAAKAESKGKKAKHGKAKGDKVPEGPAALRKYAPDYHKDNEKKTAGGNTSVDNNDDVANKLRGKSLDEVYDLAAKTLVKVDETVTVGKLKKQYAHLNVGMQRMNLGNRIRGVVHAK